jgi:hypothetical protein
MESDNNWWICQILKFVIVFGSEYSNFAIRRYVQRLDIPDEQKNISCTISSEMKVVAIWDMNCCKREILKSILASCCSPVDITYNLLCGLSPSSELYRPSDRRLSAKLVPIFADRGCHVISVADPYGRILGFLDRTCSVNLIANTHYAPITTIPSTRTKYSHKILH